MLSKIFVPSFLLFLIINSSHGGETTVDPILSPVESIEQPTTDFVKFIKTNLKTENVSRCDDFYTYVCGNWKQNEMIPEEIRDWSATKLAEFKLDKKIEIFLDNQSEIDIESAEGKARKFFSSCISMSKEIDTSMDPILDYIESKTATNIDSDWIDINFLFEEYGVNPFLKLEISHNGDNDGNDQKEIIIKYPENEWYMKIINLMQLVLTEDTEEGAKFFRYIPQAQQFYSQLQSFGENNQEPPEILTIGEFISFHNISDNINWNRFFDLALNGELDYSSWKIQNHLKNLNQYNDFLRNTDKEILGYYATMNLLSEYIGMFQDQVRIQARKSCIHLTKKHFYPALIPWLVEQTAAKEWREDVFKLINRVRDAFELRVKNNYWLDEETKAGAKSKLSVMQFIAGYTDEMIDRSALDNAYKSLDITENFWQNLLNLKQKEVSDSKWKPEAAIAFNQAVYFPKRNIFSMPLIYTQMPFYDKSFSDLMKFGGLGFVIGYGMASGFNTDNYKLNGTGKEENWWTEGALKNFTKRNECMKSQLNDLTYNNVKLIDSITMADIVTNDLGGRIAQDAYFKLMEEQSNGDRKDHAGLEFTNKEMYFVQFALDWCVGDVAYKFTKYWPSQFHATEPFRVNGVLRNKPEFAETFQCPIGSALNTEKKCP